MEFKVSRDRLNYFRGRFEYGQKLKRKKRFTLCCLCENRYELRTKQERRLCAYVCSLVVKETYIWHKS